MKFYKQKTEIQQAISLNLKKNFYRTLIITFRETKKSGTPIVRLEFRFFKLYTM